MGPHVPHHEFARDLDKQQKLCRDIGVPATNATKIQYYVESIYTSDIFDGKEMQAWEVKPIEEKPGMPPRTISSCSIRAKKSSMPSVSHAPTDMQAPTALHHVPIRPSQQEYTDHAAFLTTAQNQLLQKVEQQQEEFLTQTTKFMTLLNTKTPAPAPAPPTTSTGQPRASLTQLTTGPRSQRTHTDDPLFVSCFPPQHRVTNSKAWRRKQSHKTHHRITTHHTATKPSMTTTALKQGIMNGSIASVVSDTGATSTAGAPHDPFEETTTISSKIFIIPIGSMAKATKVAKLLPNVQTPANIVNIVPSLGQTLLSGSKFADAGYTAVYDKAEVNFYDTNTIHITEKAVLTGYRCTHTGLWCVPLRPIITNENEDTLVLDSTCGHQSTNTRYKVPPITRIHDYSHASLELPPDDHRRNIAEKAIQTWKDHFVLALSGTADNFPLHLWCQLIPQMERQLNLLQQSHSNPKILSFAHLYSHHNCNSHPFVPIGMEARVRAKPHHQKSFAQYCTKGFVLGTSIEHYRCWTIWTPVFRSTRISATVFFKHKYITNPTVTPADAIIAATENLAHVLMSITAATHLNATQLADLTRLHKIIQPASTDESPVSPTLNTTHNTQPKHNTAHPIVSDSDSNMSPQSSNSTPTHHSIHPNNLLHFLQG
eukprot:CCRYP_020386-RA/>CCRYP_020386-RA protein AED:0.51 eAED:0.20 QI:0/0/0/0.66/0.5/0.33/3/0/654